MKRIVKRYLWIPVFLSFLVWMMAWVRLVYTDSLYVPVTSRGLVFENQEATDLPVLEDLNLYAQSAVLMDGDSGRILYGKNDTQIRPMASTTKIMTCILALENGNMEDICTVSKRAAGQPKVHLGAGSGTRICLKDLLYSLMLESHNDSAVVIAEHIAGSVENFAVMMNQKARDIGCMNTWFITPNGLDEAVDIGNGIKKIHSTTASDLGRIFRYCIQESPAREQFLEITRTQSWNFQDETGVKQFSCSNHNALLTMMDGVISGKTGFTAGAGYSYVGAVESEGRTFVIAVLGCGWPPHKNWKWDDVRKLIRYGEEHFQYEMIDRKLVLSPVLVKGAKGGDCYVTLETDSMEKEFAILLSKKDTLEQIVELPQAVHAPVQKGEILGTVRYELNGNVVRMIPVYAVEGILEENWLFGILNTLKNCFLES